MLESLTIPLPADTDPIPLMPRDSFVWWRDGEGFVAWGEAARFDPGVGPDRFARAASATQDLLGPSAVAFGSFTFDPATPGSRMVVPRVAVRRSSIGATLTVTVPGTLDPLSAEQVMSTDPPPDERDFVKAVARARAEIRAGWLAKVVLARAIDIDGEFDQRALVARLTRTFPDCFVFAHDGLVGASPELLVRRNGDDVESLVLAGSAQRGVDLETDVRIGEALLASDKERSEHDFAVASTSDVLELLCDPLDSDAEPWLLKLANVQHLATKLRGRLSNPLSSLEIVGRLHPTASVCGVPATDALAMIRASEGFDRGRYAGPVGWMDANGDGEWAIALRCAQIDGGRARLYAGAGIVAGSEPERELAETDLKLKAMQDAIAG